LRSSEARYQRDTGARIAGLQHASIELSEGPLHYVEAGAGEVLLLIHGGHGSWTHWIANIGVLARTRRVIALDLPGFGASFNPQPAYSIEQYANVISAVLDALSIERAAIAGFSFGCIVASAAARDEPGRIRHLALVNAPGIGPTSPIATSLTKALSELSVRKGLRLGATESLRQIQLFNRGLIDDEVVNMMLANLRQTRFVSRVVSQSIRTDRILRGVRQPTLVFIGREDVHHQFGLAGELKAIVQHAPHAQICVIEQAAHWLQYDRAAAFNDRLAAFIG